MNGKPATLNDIWAQVLARRQLAAAQPGAPMAPSVSDLAASAPAARPIVLSPESIDAGAIRTASPVVQSAPSRDPFPNGPPPPPDPFPNGPPPPPAPPRDPMKMGYAEFQATQRAPSGGAMLGRSGPVEMELKKNVIGYDSSGAIYGPDKLVPKSQPLFQFPSSQNLEEKKRSDAAKEASAAPADPATLGNKYGGAGSPGAPGASGPAPITWGGAGGGTTTIAAHEVAAVAAPRQAAKLAAIDAEDKAVELQKDAAKASANAAEDTELAKGAGLTGQAKAAADAAAEAKARTTQAKADAKAFRAHIDDFSAKIADDKIDPNGMWNNSTTGQKIGWTLAKAFGAVGQAFLHLPTNQVADHIDQMARDDVAAQRQNHETGRERVQDMNSMYAQALKATGDAEEAERVATGYALEAAKQQAAALTANAGSKQQKTKGDEVAAALTERQAQLGEKKVDVGIAMNPYAQARTVSTGPDMKEVYKTARQFTEEQAKLGTVVPPDAAIAWAYKMHTGKDPLPGGYTQGAKAEPGGKTEKLDEARTEVQGGIGTIDRALKSGAAYKQGPIGAAWANVPGATDSKMDALAREKYNAQAKALVGAAWKLTTNGMEPKNPGIIEELSGHYQIHPSDSEDLARAKMKELQNTLRDAGTSKGVLFDETRKDLAGIPGAFKPGAAGPPAPPPSFTPTAKK